LGDRFGRKRIFSIGVAWFAVTSMACGLAPNAGFLIATRALQGIGAALLTPGSLAILQASFEPEDRAQAIGAWSGLGGLTTAAGPLVGGYLIAVASWRWVFFINVPIVAVVLLLTARHVPESRDPTTAGALDSTGAALGVIWLTAVTFALIEGPTYGWSSPLISIMLGIAVIGLGSFILVEKRRRYPMLPLSLFRTRQFSATNAVTFVVYAALGGALFLLPIELQVVSGYSPLQSGLALLPVTAIMLVFSARSGRLATRLGPRLQMSVGPIVVGLGLALLMRATDGPSYVVYVLPAVLTFGAGLAITVAPLTATAMSAVPMEHAGLASAVNNDVARTGGLIAVAVLPALAGITGTSYLHAHQLAGGFRTAVAIAAGACVAGGVLAALAIRNPALPPASPADRECLHCALDAPPVRASTGAP
jgi:EmrB/QacA subfamily drug resistance transporter